MSSKKKTRLKWPYKGTEYLLEEIGVSGPEDRAGAMEAGNAGWPEGWWGVFDEMGGYIAYFEHASDAYGFRLTLVNSRMNMRETNRRYTKVDKNGG